MKKRIIGIDLARALAVIGMIIVNFKVVFGDNGSSGIKYMASVFDGKAAATFVVLAGIGLALMTKTALQDRKKLRAIRKRIAKRALFLFIVGTSYISIWPADILHFYGVYMIILLLFLKSNEKVIFLSGSLLVLIYPVLMMFWDYEVGWDFNALEYTGFWTFKGFIRNLLFNGFHPVIPWAAFMLFGYWLGKQELHNIKFVRKTFWISIITFGFIQCLSYLSISILSEGNHATAKELTEILGTNPMPPLPMYMVNGVAIAFTVISACILIAKRFDSSWIIDALNKTGQLALTFYVAHVIVGMGVVEAINPEKLGKYSVEFSLVYALVFSFVCVLFAVFWKKYNEIGPLEWIMQKLLD